MQQALKIAGLANCTYNIIIIDILLTFSFCSYLTVPQTFVIWWNAWNDRDHVSYPLPPSMAHYTLAPELAAFNHLLFNRRGDESKNGITVRKAWEKLDSVARDLMVHCWCRKNSNDIIRNAIAHPDMTKGGARELLTQDLCHDLQYLYPRAMTYISNAPEIFKADSASL
jgi:hypothetical protein